MLPRSAPFLEVILDSMATLEDVARKADVSISTVSRVFNNPEKVHPDTQERVREAVDERTVVGYDADGDSVFVDRWRAGAAGFHEGFAARHAAPLAPRNGRVTLHVFVDRSSVEVFANDGARVLTHRIFPDAATDGVSPGGGRDGPARAAGRLDPPLDLAHPVARLFHGPSTHV